MPPRKRKQATKQVLHTVYAVVEGQNTETSYVAHLDQCLPKPNGLRIVAEHPSSARKALFERAREIIKETDEDSDVWVICDVDDDGPLLAELLKRKFKGSERLNWAISNPEFAVWLVMHYADCTRSEGRKEYARRARELGIATGTNGKSIDFTRLATTSGTARTHARAARHRHSGVTDFPDNNPQSDLDLFVDRLIALHNKHRADPGEPLTFESLY